MSVYILLAEFHRKHNSGYTTDCKNGKDAVQLLRFDTDAQIKIGDDEYYVKPNTAVLIDSNVPYSLSATEDEYIDDCISFQLTYGERERFNQLDVLVNIPIDLGDDNFLELMIQSCCNVFNNKYADNYEIEHSLLKSVILYLKGIDNNISHEKYIPYENELRKLRNEIFANPGIQRTAPGVAKELNLSVVYLTKIYRNMFGTSYMRDLFSARMQHAQFLLADTDKSVYEIAGICGYNSSEYFSVLGSQISPVS